MHATPRRRTIYYFCLNVMKLSHPSVAVAWGLPRHFQRLSCRFNRLVNEWFESRESTDWAIHSQFRKFTFTEVSPNWDTGWRLGEEGKKSRRKKSCARTSQHPPWRNEKEKGDALVEMCWGADERPKKLRRLSKATTRMQSIWRFVRSSNLTGYSNDT